MPLTLTMPKLSPTMDTGVLVKWHKKEGDHVQPGDLLFEVATDKATVEHLALDEGWLRKILVQEGEEAAINQPLAILTEEKEESIAGYQPQGSAPLSLEKEKKREEPQASQAPTPEEKKGEEALMPPPRGAFMAPPRFAPEVPLENYSFEFPSKEGGKRLLASPLAKKLAKEKGLDLSTIKGSGPHQRIMSRDLDKAQPASPISFFPREVPSLPPGTYEEIPLSPMRKVIAQRLQEAKAFIPHFYVTMEVDAEPLVALREQLKNYEMKFSVNDFIIKACAFALRGHPEMNRGFHAVNQTLIQFKTIDIAVAVSVEGGLMTPLIRHADYKNLGELAAEMRRLIQRAREGRLEPGEYKGGSFTLSNLGMYGVTEFQAILNPPQAAILAVGGIQEVPVVRQGRVVPGKTLHLTLSVDHRVVDGAVAALFLQTVKKNLENPSILLMN